MLRVIPNAHRQHDTRTNITEENMMLCAKSLEMAEENRGSLKGKY